MSKLDEVAHLDATDQADLVRRKEVQPIELVEPAPDVDGSLIIQAFFAVWSAGVSSTLDSIARVTGQPANGEKVELLTWALAEMGRKVNASDYLLALQLLQGLGRVMVRFHVDYDLFLTPTPGEPPVPIGTFDSPPENPLQGFFRTDQFVPFAPLCNCTGQPAMSVPPFWNAEGLPMGTHVVGRFGHEATLFRLASQLEEARPCAVRRPPIWG